MGDEEIQAGEAQGNTEASGEAEQSSTIATPAAEETGEEAKGEPEAEGQEEKGEGTEEKEPDATELDPEKFTMPENYGEVDKESLSEFAALAKEDGLSQERAQKYMDLATKAVLKEREGQAQYWKTSRDQWEKDVKADPEMGGNNFKETNVRAQRAVAKLNDPQLKAFLADGFGNHPSIVRALIKYDKATSDMKVVEGDGPAPNGVSTAKTLYPDHN